MKTHPILTHLKELPSELEVLCAEATTDGFRFLGSLVNEWNADRNRFNASGEVFLGAFLNNQLVAVGGLNIDPYTTDAGIARLRHVYVLKRARRQGLATALVRVLLEGSREAGFSKVRLLTDTDAGARFYQAMGFCRLESAHVSHVMSLAPVSYREHHLPPLSAEQ